jgi:hypothetical protein
VVGMNGVDSLHIVLDMDETLICFVDNTVWDGLSKAEQKSYESVNVMDGTCVFRPNLQIFLDTLFSLTNNVFIWTRGTHDYAVEILKEVRKKTGHAFKHLFSREQCNKAFALNGYDKDLQYLWDLPKFNFTKRNTILIDDLKTNTQNPNNRKNSIQIMPFLISPLINLSDDNTLLLVINILYSVQKMYVYDQNKSVKHPFQIRASCVNCN